MGHRVTCLECRESSTGRCKRHRSGVCTRCGELFVNCYGPAACDGNLTRRCIRIVEAAQADLGVDLGGGSILDLVADNLPHVPLIELKAALVRAGFTQYEVKT